MTLSADERAAIAAAHRPRNNALEPGFGLRVWCLDDGKPWPCDTEKMRAALAAAEEREKALAEALEHIHFTAHGSRCYTPAGCASRTALAAYREAGG